MHDAEFMTAAEKSLVLKQWIRFIKNGFQENDFTEKLYKHLSLHCSFIAHYNRLGFYGTYFDRPEMTAKFLTQFDKDYNYKSVEYGGRWWLNNQEYCDLNQAMCDAIEPYKRVIYEQCLRKQRESDVGIAKALLQKHGIELRESAA